jgi:hypothetical protein
MFGTLELDDYASLFAPEDHVPVPAGMAPYLRVRAGQPVVYYPRRSFDFWGARYFILPARPGWQSRERGFASFLSQTELIHPSADLLYERSSKDGQEPWGLRQDWQLRRNLAAYPRAWVVHSARVRAPASDPETRAEWISTILYMNDPIWSERDRPVFDLRQTALIETHEKEALKGFLSSAPVEPSETVTVLAYQPNRVELRARLDRPGLVILADTYYPGWRLTIDGRPAPIFRANRMMRGAAVPEGEHSLVYTYAPLSFRIGAMVSTAGLLVLLALVGSSWREPRAPPRSTHGFNWEPL